jgi:hypothetical protein
MSAELAPPFFFGSGFSVSALYARDEILAKALETQKFSSGALDASVRGWLSYLESLKHPRGEMSTVHVDAVRWLWKMLSREIGMGIRPPLTQVTGDDVIQLAWETGQLYFDIDVFPDGTLAWFFRDRASGTAEGTEDEHLTSIPPEAIRRLKSVLGQ